MAAGLHIERRSGSIGARVCGLDLARLDQSGTIAAPREALYEHLPINDYHGHRRLMHRVTLRGDVPVAADHGVPPDA